MSSNLYYSEGDITPAQRHAITHGGAVVWFTGLSGSGKSTVARAVEKKLVESGVAAFRLDGDNLRLGLNSDLGFSPSDRDENIRRASCVAALMEEAGLTVLVCAISPFEAARQAAKARCKNFITVYVKASLAACAARDVKGLYKKAFEGKIPDFTGVSSPYEPPEHPDIVLDTECESIDECVRKVLDKLKTNM